MTDEIKKMKCNRCKVLLPDYKFTKKKNDEYQKSCERCRGLQKEEREKYLCPHKRQRNKCIECGGSQICIHKRLRIKCIDCDGASICIHKRQRNDCKKCYNPIKITIKNMIKGSRQSDKKCNRYDANNFIDKCFLEGLVEEYPLCYYEDCKIELQYVEYQDNLATVERIDNSIGHIKSNCVLCCKKCNNIKKSNNLLK